MKNTARGDHLAHRPHGSRSKALSTSLCFSLLKGNIVREVGIVIVQLRSPSLRYLLVRELETEAMRIAHPDLISTLAAKIHHMREIDIDEIAIIIRHYLFL